MGVIGLFVSQQISVRSLLREVVRNRIAFNATVSSRAVKDVHSY